MKSILAGLLILSLTPLSKCYSQTDGSIYCLPIEKARQVISQALKGQLTDSLLTVADNRISLLEDEKLSSYASFTNLLKIEQDKNKIQSEIILHSESISKGYKEENTHLKKKVRGLKWQRAGLGVLVIVVTVLSMN